MTPWQPPRSIYPAVLFSLIFWLAVGVLLYEVWAYL